MGELFRLAQGARNIAEIWKMDLKGSGSMGFIALGEPSRRPGEPESQAISRKWILKAQKHRI